MIWRSEFAGYIFDLWGAEAAVLEFFDNEIERFL